MALNSGGGNSDAFFVLKIVDKDQDKKRVSPHFVVKAKENEQWVNVKHERPITNVKGDLIKVEVVEREFNGNPYKAIHIFLRDAKAGETYMLDVRINMATQGLFNSLFNLSAFSNVEVSVYTTEKDDKKYTSVGVRQNGEQVKWKYGKDELPKVKKIPVKNKPDVIDSSDLDEFLEKELLNLGERLKDHPKVDDVPEEEVEDTSDIEF